jgi:uncharacterized damage-inducible protein DinB
MLETIRLLYDYNRWADDRTLAVAAKLAPEPFTRDLGSSHKSVRDTLVHAFSGQWIWLSRWKGVSPKAMWPATEFPSVDAVRARCEEVSREQAEFVAAQREATLERPVTYQNLKGETITYPLGQLMLHVVNHSTYHRGQVTTLLRQLGATPVSTDLVLYCAEHRG